MEADLRRQRHGKQLGVGANERGPVHAANGIRDRFSSLENSALTASLLGQLAQGGQQLADQLLGFCVSQVAVFVELFGGGGDHDLGLVDDGHVEEDEALAQV